MAGLKTPQLADLDDPLAPRPPAARSAPAPASASRARKPPAGRAVAPRGQRGASLADEELVAVFARVPESLSAALADAVRRVNAERSRRDRVSQQDLMGALLDRYLASGDGLTTGDLSELADAYRARLRR